MAPHPGPSPPGGAASDCLSCTGPIAKRCQGGIVVLTAGLSAPAQRGLGSGPPASDRRRLSSCFFPLEAVFRFSWGSVRSIIQDDLISRSFIAIHLQRCFCQIRPHSHVPGLGPGHISWGPYNSSPAAIRSIAVLGAVTLRGSSGLEGHERCPRRESLQPGEGRPEGRDSKE